MNEWTLNLPAPVEFGAGCIEKLPNYLRGAKKVLVVSGLAGTQAAVAVDWVCDTLKKAGAESHVFDKISAEAHCEEVEEGSAAARELGTELVIGLRRWKRHVRGEGDSGGGHS